MSELLRIVVKYRDLKREKQYEKEKLLNSKEENERETSEILTLKNFLLSKHQILLTELEQRNKDLTAQLQLIQDEQLVLNAELAIQINKDPNDTSLSQRLIN